ARPLPRARRFSEWAAALRELLAARVRGFEALTGDPGGADAVGGAGTIAAALDDLRLLDATGLPFSSEAACRFLDRAVAAGRVPLGSVGADGIRGAGDRGGLRVLDAVQARGLSCDALFVLGMNVDRFPRRPREDPFLPDEDRRRLRESLRRPVPVAA